MGPALATEIANRQGGGRAWVLSWGTKGWLNLYSAMS